MSTSNQYVKYTIAVTQNSQNVTSNSSNVTVSVRFYRTNTGYTTYGTGTVYCKINGTTYSAAIGPTQKITNSGIVLFTKTLDIPHNDDGTKALVCSAWISLNSPLTSNEQSYTQTLTTIPRKSTMSVTNGTLGTAQTLTVSRQSSNFSHTIVATCGSASTTICTKSTSTSISFTPPLSWASQNVANTAVTVKYTITTFSGDTNVGSNTYQVTCSMPASIAPTCSVAVTDGKGYSATYGGFIKGRSTMNVVITATPSYGADIVSYSSTVNGTKYSSKSFVTDTIKNAGTQTVNVTVIDKRGRTGTVSASVNVIDYEPPNITKLTVKRCDVNGAENDKGAYICVTFSYKVATISNLNYASYQMKYKKSSETTWTDITDSDWNGFNTIEDAFVIFEADTGSSYEIMMSLSDNFETVTKSTVASTAATIMHFKASGLGMGIGKVAELDDVLDIEYQTRLNGGLLYPIVQNSTDLNDVITPGFYTLKSIQSSDYTNCPPVTGTATLIVESCGEVGQLRQIITNCNKTNPIRYERYFYQDEWGDWLKTNDIGGKILWSGGSHMNGGQYATLTEPISSQLNGVLLIFSRYTDLTVHDYNFTTHFVSKAHVAAHPGCGHVFMMTTDGIFDVFAAKYLYISDTGISGHANNTKNGTGACGITYLNSDFVLRYVIGV